MPNDRVPPSAVEVEMAVLGAAMRDTDAAISMVGQLNEDDFYRPAHRFVFSAIRSLAVRSEPVDVATIANALDGAGKLEVSGGRVGLIDIVESVFTAANLPAHIAIVKEKATLRRILSVCKETEEGAYDAVDAMDLLDKHRSTVESISGRHAQDSCYDACAIATGALNNVEVYRTHGVSKISVPTTYVRLDDLLGGMRRGDFLVVAGRPSMGKTALGLNIAMRLTAQGRAVGLFSLEMSQESIGERMITHIANVDSLLMRSGRLSSEQYARIGEAARELSKRPFVLDDEAAISVFDLRSRARRMKSQHGTEVVMVDYLQLLRGQGDNREQEVASVSRMLKAVAKDLNVPVLAMAQINRMAELRSDRKPQLSDLRETGSIEQDADVVMFVYRPEYYGVKSDDVGSTENRMDVIVAKQRNGPTGVVHLVFHRNAGRIEPWTGLGVGFDTQSEGVESGTPF